MKPFDKKCKINVNFEVIVEGFGGVGEERRVG
jgi:hypothetical protein